MDLGVSPFVNFIVHKLCEIKTNNLDDNTHIGRLITIYNYSNAPSIALLVYRLNNMVNTAYTSREDKCVARHFSGKIQKVHSILILSTCL